ncbi:hypothetical protein D6745_03230, partial [Candidatus Woesearchaeota archaeon]
FIGGKLKMVIRKQIAIFTLLIFLMSIIPTSFAREDMSIETRIKAPNAQNIKPQPQLTAKNPQLAQVKKVENRLRVCFDFLKKNSLSDTPLLTCNKLIRKEISCVDFLKEKGIDEPLEKCDKFFKKSAQIIKDRPYLAKDVASAVAEPRLKKLDKLVASHPKVVDFVKNLPEEKAKVFLHLPRAEQKKLLGEDTYNAEKELSKFKLKKVKKSMLFKKRIISPSKVKKAEEEFKLAEEAYKKANKAYKEKKSLFLSVKEQLKNCKGVDTTKCNDLREKVKEHAKDFLINAADMAIEHLKKIKHKVESSEEIDEAKADEIITEIDNTISKLEDVKSQVEAADTKEEIQKAAQAINRIWKGIKHKEKLHAARLVHAKVWNIIKRSEHLEERLDFALANMEEQGISIDNIEPKVNEFSEKIAFAKDNYEKAKELFKQAEGLKTENPTEDERTQVLELVTEARQLLRDAHESLKEAHTILMEIIREIKAQGGELQSEEEPEEEGLGKDEVYEVVEESYEDEGSDDDSFVGNETLNETSDEHEDFMSEDEDLSDEDHTNTIKDDSKEHSKKSESSENSEEDESS